MKNKTLAQADYIRFNQYLKNLWPISVLILFAQTIIHFTENPLIAHIPSALFFINPFILIVMFAFGAYWSHQSVRNAIVEESHENLEQSMAMLPIRSFKGFVITGLISFTFILGAVFLSTFMSGYNITARMLLSLVLTIGFSMSILIPVIAVALTVAWMAKVRKRLSLQELFVGNLEQLQYYPWLLRSSNRPWLIFTVTSLIPVTILGIFTWLMLGSEIEAEKHFILMQALVMFTNLIAGGITLIWVTSRTVRKIIQELTQGLTFLRKGKFDGHVAIMIDDEMGDLARGLNTALDGLKERDSLKDALDIASDIQKGLMPKNEPHISGYEVMGFQQSCHAVGGDYFDYIKRNEDTTWLVIADVAGKGYPAALTVANLQAMLHALANGENISLLDAAKYINLSLYQTLQGGRFVTLFVAELNHKTHQLHWINTGHIPPLLWRDHALTKMEASSPPLGMLETIPLHVQSITLNPGDTFFACTDGITESRNASGKMFGDYNVEEWFIGHHHLSPNELPSSMLSSLDKKRFHIREDDITMLCLKRSDHAQ